MASPSPVPPKRRVVEGSACANDWNRFARASGEMPMPVSRTSRTNLARGLTKPADDHLAALGELHRVADEVRQDLPEPQRIAP
jgi:hypothetical protein